MTRLLITAVVLSLALAGCSGGDHAGHEHDTGTNEHSGHVHEAPRGGALLVLAEETAHIELTFDPATGTLDLYALGPHAAQPVRLAAPEIVLHVYRGGEAILMKAQPVASELTGETVGDTSQYRGQDDRLIGAETIRGDVKNVEVRGVQRETVAFTWPPN